MLRIFLLLTISISFAAHAGKNECEKAKNNDTQAAQDEWNQYKARDAERSAAAKAAGSSPMVNGGGALQQGTADNIADIQTALSNNKARKKHCNKVCNPQYTDTPPSQPVAQNQEKQQIVQLRQECNDTIDQYVQDEQKDLATNQAANPKAGDTKDTTNKTADAKPSSSGSSKGGGSSPMMPPMMPPPQQQSSNSNQQPTQTADNSQPPQSPAAPAAPTQQSNQNAQTGSAGFKTPTATQDPCHDSRLAASISGCNATSAAAAPPTQYANAVTPFGSNAYNMGAGGYMGGGSSGGGLAAAAAALTNGAKLPGQTEKDGKNTGIKAASLNLGTDGGGGGGGGSSGSGYDLDFSSLKGQPMRAPASGAIAKATPASATGPLSQVGAQRVSVTKIVTDVYVDRCNAGRFLHCGNNK